MLTEYLNEASRECYLQFNSKQYIANFSKQVLSYQKTTATKWEV